MAPTSSKSKDDLEILKTTVGSTLTLIKQLSNPAAPAQNAPNSNVNALDLAHDAASLIRAHSTKLSLLIINKPFTASAITKILQEVIAGPLPGLASAIELCDASKYTKAMSSELRYRSGRTFTEFGRLVDVIPLDGQILSDDAKNGTAKVEGNGSLAATGTVWAACDSVIELKVLGVAGLVAKKADEYRATLKDALEELQEWAEEESDEEDGQGESGDELDDKQAAVDDFFGNQRHIPADDPEKIRPRLESSLKRLRLLILMYQAVSKRRFKTLPLLPRPEILSATNEDQLAASMNTMHIGQQNGREVVPCLDEVLDLMKKIPDITDELASAFYELDSSEIDKHMDECFLTGFAVAELLMKNWEGKDDEFSAWAQKFQAAIKKP